MSTFISIVQYYAVIDELIEICFGPGLEISREITFIITLNQFTKYMRSTALLFRDASGTFYYDRWKPLFEGVVNLILSLVFVMVFPQELKVVGVIVATIITTLLICHIVEPYVIFKHVFGKMPYKFWLKNYCYIGIFMAALSVMSHILSTEFHDDNLIMGLLVNGAFALGVAVLLLGMLAVGDKAFRKEVLKLRVFVNMPKTL